MGYAKKFSTNAQYVVKFMLSEVRFIVILNTKLGQMGDKDTVTIAKVRVDFSAKIDLRNSCCCFFKSLNKKCGSYRVG